MPLYHSCLGTLINSTQQEYFTGAACTGASGATNRVLTLTNTNLTNDVIVFLDGLCLHNTLTTITNLVANSTIQFLRPVDNDNLIVVYYIA